MSTRALARDRDYVQSLERGLAVMRAFSRESPTLTLSEVAERTALTRAAARRFLLTLESLGYVAYDGARNFSLRPRVLELGYAYLSALDLPDVATPFMEGVVETLQESCSISVLDGTEIVYVARVPTKRIMTVNLAVGSRLPAHCTSMGRVLLAALPPVEQDRFFVEAELVALTARTVTDEVALRGILAAVQAAGYALVDQELEDGVRSVAAPIRDHTCEVCAAVNASAHASRVPVEELRERFVPVLQDAALVISQALGSPAARIRRRARPA